MHLLGYILYEKLQVTESGNASYYTLSREDMLRFNFKRGDAEGIVNLPLQIKGFEKCQSLCVRIRRKIMRSG